MIRRPPRSTLDRSSAASDVYKRQTLSHSTINPKPITIDTIYSYTCFTIVIHTFDSIKKPTTNTIYPVSYTHLRAHETPEHLVCRLLLEKKKKTKMLRIGPGT